MSTTLYSNSSFHVFYQDLEDEDLIRALKNEARTWEAACANISDDEHGKFLYIDRKGPLVDPLVWHNCFVSMVCVKRTLTDVFKIRRFGYGRDGNSHR